MVEEPEREGFSALQMISQVTQVLSDGSRSLEFSASREGSEEILLLGVKDLAIVAMEPDDTVPEESEAIVTVQRTRDVLSARRVSRLQRLIGSVDEVGKRAGIYRKGRDGIFPNGGKIEFTPSSERDGGRGDGRGLSSVGLSTFWNLDCTRRSVFIQQRLWKCLASTAFAEGGGSLSGSSLGDRITRSDGRSGGNRNARVGGKRSHFANVVERGEWLSRVPYIKGLVDTKMLNRLISED